MEPTVSSETSAIRTQTPGNYPKRNKLQFINTYETRYKHLKDRPDDCYWPPDLCQHVYLAAQNSPLHSTNILFAMLVKYMLMNLHFPLASSMKAPVNYYSGKSAELGICLKT